MDILLIVFVDNLVDLQGYLNLKKLVIVFE